MPNPVLDLAATFRAQALQRERAAATALVRAYGQVYRNLDPQIRALEEALRGLDNPRPVDIQRLASLRVLREQTIEQVNRYAAFADTTIAGQVHVNVAVGLRDSEALVQAHFDPAWLAENGLRLNTDVQGAIRASWVRVPTEAVETMVGMTQADSPLRQALVHNLGDTVAQQMVDALVVGIATGKNPRVIARQVMGNGLDYSLTTARTAQLWAYREASRANYMANRDIVSGWRWSASLSARTCASCLAMHGTVHPVDEALNDHHNGRCLVPGQTVTTRRGLVAIESVQVGDFVLTHNGRWRAVTATSQRPYLGKVYQFMQDGFSLTVTAEHPMLTQRGWVAARDCNASDTLRTLNDIDARVSSRSIVHPSSVNLASRVASRLVRAFVMCQRGSSSTASIASGSAASMLYDPTASCGTGDNPAVRSASINSISRGVQNVTQSRCLVWARAKARRCCASGRSIRVIASGLRSMWRNAAALGEIGSIPDSRIQRISVRMFTHASVHSSRYVASSPSYRRRNHSATGSPNLAAALVSNRAMLSAPTSCGVNRSPNAFARCSTALCVRPGSDFAISIGSNRPNHSRITASSSDVHALPDIAPPFAMGTIIHQPIALAQVDYDGIVYNLQVEQDESYVANGIVVHNCSAIPIVPLAARLGIPEPDMGDAEQWLKVQPESVQQEMLGKGVYEGYKDGSWGLKDLTTTYEDSVYGTMRRPPTLEMLEALSS